MEDIDLQIFVRDAKDHDIEKCVRMVVARLPEPVREWIRQAEPFFILVSGEMGENLEITPRRSYAMEHGAVPVVRLILLSETLRASDRQTVLHVIANQIAYSYESDGLPKTPEKDDRARALAAEWGFPPLLP